MWYRSSQWNDWLGLSWWSVCSPFQSFQRGVHCKDWQSYHSIDYSMIHCTKVCFNQWVYNKDGGGEISILILHVFNLHFFFIFKSKNKEKKWREHTSQSTFLDWNCTSTKTLLICTMNVWIFWVYFVTMATTTVFAQSTRDVWKIIMLEAICACSVRYQFIFLTLKNFWMEINFI